MQQTVRERVVRITGVFLSGVLQCFSFHPRRQEVDRVGSWKLGAGEVHVLSQASFWSLSSAS